MNSPFLGMVQYFAFDWAPKGYMLCNGNLLPIQQYSALFALLGTYYGGNGTSTFGLPDLRGRAVVGQGPNNTIGEIFGTTGVTLLTSNMPAHSHAATSHIQVNISNTGSVVSTPQGSFPGGFVGQHGAAAASLYNNANTNGAFLATPSVTVGITGSNLPVSTQNPYLAVTACISINGIFPSRN